MPDRLDFGILKEWRRRKYGNISVWIDCAQQLGLRSVETLASLRANGSPSPTDRGQAMWVLVKDAIKKLRPDGEPLDTSRPEWALYTILWDAYVEGRKNSAIMHDLFIGEGTLERARRSGIDRVAQIIAEGEATYDPELV